MKKRIFLGIIPLLFSLFFISCKKDKGGPLLISVEEDKKIGLQMYEYFRDSSDFMFLDPAQYPNQYAYLNGLMDKLLRSSDVRYRDRFDWKVTIIKNDDELNAFATPGGYLYFYTGIIKYLDCEDDLAGVLGHEIAHSDRRHSMKQLEKVYTVSFLLDLALGKNRGAISQVATQLLALSFSRDAENEADAYSVKYLCQADDLAANGAAGFFEKLEASGSSGRPPAFLSTHPPSDKRIQNINTAAQDANCNTSRRCSSAYTNFKNSLP